jgi:hypothetical protein
VAGEVQYDEHNHQDTDHGEEELDAQGSFTGPVAVVARGDDTGSVQTVAVLALAMKMLFVTE